MEQTRRPFARGWNLRREGLIQGAMAGSDGSHLLIWIVCVPAVAGVIVRPFRTPEAVWAGAGALILVASGLLPVAVALTALRPALDVCLFLLGMMLLSEVARQAGLFERLAGLAVNYARRSPRRLFLLTYVAGVLVTATLSNDATAVVMTPAVFAAARAASAQPAPLLFICAFVANAASFLLPISNPANLVLYGERTPPLGTWLAAFALPAVLAVISTYLLLRWRLREELRGLCAGQVSVQPMTSGAWAAMAGITATIVVLLVASSSGALLGPPTFAMGAFTAAVACLRGAARPLRTLRGVSWPVLALVAGLFVLAAGLDATGVVDRLSATLASVQVRWPPLTAWSGGGAIALISNLINNLPAGLIASATVAKAHASRSVIDALLIGVDLGPNLSVTGSLATILWLSAVRREGYSISGWRFLKLGIVVTPPALLLALAARALTGAA